MPRWRGVRARRTRCADFRVTGFRLSRRNPGRWRRASAGPTAPEQSFLQEPAPAGFSFCRTPLRAPGPSEMMRSTLRPLVFAAALLAGFVRAEPPQPDFAADLRARYEEYRGALERNDFGTPL